MEQNNIISATPVPSQRSVSEILEPLMDKKSWDQMSLQKKLDVSKEALELLETAINSEITGLNNSLSKLDGDNLEVDLQRNFIGVVKKDSIEKAFESVYADLKDYISICGKAISCTNLVVMFILKLNQLMAKIEEDLYKDLDDQMLSSNALKDTLLDLFKKQGISDDAVRELIDTNFSRTLTLRDRIKSLRAEYKEAITSCETRIATFELKHQNIDEETKRIIREANESLKGALDAGLCQLDQLYSEKSNTLTALSNSAIKNIDDRLKLQEELHQSIEAMFKSVKNLSTAFDVKYKDDEQQLVALFDSKSKEAKDNLSELAEQKQKEVVDAGAEAQNSIKNDFDTLDAKIQENIQKQEQYLEQAKKDFQLQLRNQQEQFDREKEKLMSSSIKKITIAIISSLSLSGIISFLVVSMML